jgi:hypothetical protein
MAGFTSACRADYAFNLEHPPLAKDLAGLMLCGARLGIVPDAWKHRDTLGNLTELFLYRNVLTSGPLLLRARLLFPAVLLVLGALVFCAARTLGAKALALPAALWVVLEPTAVAHAAYVHNDVAAALTTLAAVLAWLAVLRKPTVPRAVLTGLLCGVALATKFSAIALVPVFAAAAVVFLAGRAERTAYVGVAALSIPIAAIALGVVTGIYKLHLRGMTGEEIETVRREHMAKRGVPAGRVQAVEDVAERSPALAHFLAGLVGVLEEGSHGRGMNFLDGRLSSRGFPQYFALAWLYKTPPALVLLAALGLAAAVRLARLDRTPLVLYACALALFGVAAFSRYNIGIRHMLPAYPLLALGAAAALERTFPARTARGVAWGAAALVLLETLSVHPHEISYFSVLAGGPTNGPSHLSDSNVDWGQDLWRLREELGPPPRPRVSIAYFGGASVRFEMPNDHDLRFEPADASIPAGLYAVSELLLLEGPELYEISAGDANASAFMRRLRDAIRRRGREAGRIGDSIHLFRLAPEPALSK